MVFARDGRYVYEAKIWRGLEYHEQGLREISEYILGENDNEELQSIFYIVFDATQGGQAQIKLGGETTSVSIEGKAVNIIVVSLTPPMPSRKK